MYKTKKFNLGAVYNNHLYSGIIGVFMKYCHKKLESFKTDNIFSKVLEIGAGTAPHTTYIKHKFDSYYIVETSDFAIDYLKKEGLKKVIKYDQVYSYSFDVKESLLERIIHNLDDVDITLKHKEQIEAYELLRRQQRPWLFDYSN